MGISKRLAVVIAALALAACAPQAAQPSAADRAEPTPLSTPVANTPAPTLAIGGAPALPTREVSGSPPPGTCTDAPTPDYGPTGEPSHAPVNGQPSLSEPHRRGVILVKIVQCRDINEILRKYGLLGPATQRVPSASATNDHIARWYEIVVTVGTESATVVNLFRHPEDIEYVQLLPEFRGGAAGARNCDFATPYGVNTGENAPYGYVADQIEVTFCGNRRLSAGEAARFMTTYRLELVTISAPQDQSQNAYYFRITTGATPPEMVRRIAADPDIRSVSVVPLGRATGLTGQ